MIKEDFDCNDVGEEEVCAVRELHGEFSILLEACEEEAEQINEEQIVNENNADEDEEVDNGADDVRGDADYVIEEDEDQEIDDADEEGAENVPFGKRKHKLNYYYIK